MENFTPFESAIGGMLIGLASAGVVWLQRRIVGISGIVGGALFPRTGDLSWRVAFVAGLMLSGAVIFQLAPQRFSTTGVPGLPLVIVAGLLVGFGTQLGSGCTSGHGVCGLGRMSRRSLVATATFLATAALTVLVTHHLLGAI
jgi:uncharacterized membrane protein YedE/YeeE